MLAKPNFQNWLWSARRPLNGLKPHRKSGELQRLYGRSKPRLSGQGWSSSQPMRPRGLACVLSIAPANMPRGAGLGRADKRGLGGQGGGTLTVGRSRGRSEARLAAEPKRPTSQISKRSQLLRRKSFRAGLTTAQAERARSFYHLACCDPAAHQLGYTLNANPIGGR